MNERPSLRFSRGLQRIAATVALTAYVVLTALGASLVFCHEADGQIAIEWSGADCCVDLGDAGRHADDAVRGSIAPSSGGADCVECVDVPATKLLTSTADRTGRSTASRTAEDLAAHAAALPQSPAPWTLGTASRTAGPFTASIPPPRVAMLRTVVLRC